MKELIFAVDFDGTCVTHEYPMIGKDIGAVPVLQKISKSNKIILYTMRDGKFLDDAVEWFSDNNIPLFGINDNPEQYAWTSSRKVYANFIIDDTAIGCPLVYQDEFQRPYVDWNKIEQFLLMRKLI